MQVRYRKLSGKFDPAAYEVALANQGPRLPWNGPGKRIVFGATARVAAPVEVNVAEGEGSLDEVRLRLKEGELRPRDLVDIGSGWQTLDSCYPFEDITETFRAQARRRDLLGWMGFVLAALVACVALFAAFRSLVVDVGDVPTVLGPAATRPQPPR